MRAGPAHPAKRHWMERLSSAGSSTTAPCDCRHTAACTRGRSNVQSRCAARRQGAHSHLTQTWKTLPKPSIAGRENGAPVAAACSFPHGSRPDAVLDPRRDGADLCGGALHVVASARASGGGAERDADELARTPRRRARCGDPFHRRRHSHGGGQLEELDPPREQYVARIRGILAAWPDVYGSTIAVEVGRDPDARPFAPYFFRSGGEIAYSDLARRQLRLSRAAMVSPRSRFAAAGLVVALFRRGRRRHLDGDLLGAVLSQAGRQPRGCWPASSPRISIWTG